MTLPSHSSTQIRDSLYDLMPLSAAAVAVMQQPAFLRLDGIQQLGFASRVWPGAKHTRYEHSLGVMHLTERAVQHLRTLPEGAFITDVDAQVVIAAALLHDIGHYPFSHAIEELGADPTVMTPCADVTGVQGMGLVQAMGEPRLTIAQALSTLLAAEVIDAASWELLIDLAQRFGQDSLVERFSEALAAEERHDATVRAWLAAAIREEAEV